MNDKKWISYLLICLIFIGGVYTAYKVTVPTISAPQMAINFYNLTFKQEDSPLITAGISEETTSALLMQLNTTFKEHLSLQLTSHKDLFINSKELDALYTAYTTLLNKLTVTAHVIHRDGLNTCEVALTTTFLDFEKMDNISIDNALDTIHFHTYKNENLYLHDLTSAYLKELIHIYTTTEPSLETHTTSFIFKRENNIWVPSDLSLFLTTLCQMITPTYATPES